MSTAENSQVGLATAIAHYNAGVRSMQEGDPDAAAAEWRHAVELDPGMSPAWRNLAVYHEERGNDPDVLDAYQQLLEFDPYDTQALIRGASAARRQGNVELGIRLYERALGVYPYFRHWYEEIAALCDQAGRTDDGEKWREAGREHTDDEAEMAFEDGVRQARSGNRELAIAIFDAVLEEQPSNVDARVRIAALLHASGRTSDAIGHFDDALSSTETVTPLVLYHRARLLLDVGRPEDAVSDLQTATELNAKFGRAKRLLKRLGGAPPGKAEATDPASVRKQEGPKFIGSHSRAPALQPPDPERPWPEQVRFLLNQASQIQSRTGGRGRVVILFDAAAQMIPVARSVLELAESPDAALIDPSGSRAYCVEGEAHDGAGTYGITAEGWLRNGYDEPDYGRWSPEPVGIPIDCLLEAAQLAVGSDGFNLVVIVSTGQVRADQTATEQFARALATYQVVVVQPHEPAGDLADRLRDCVPNFVAISAQTQ